MRLHNKQGIVCKGPGYPSNRPHRRMTFSELAYWLLKHVIKVTASQYTNPEVSYSMGRHMVSLVVMGLGIVNEKSSIIQLIAMIFVSALRTSSFYKIICYHKNKS